MRYRYKSRAELWAEAERLRGTESALARLTGYAARGHVLITPETCGCDKRSDRQCNVCDGGLAICDRCGAAEVELDRECAGPVRHIVSLSDQGSAL